MSSIQWPLSVYLAPVADLHHEDAQRTILDVANHPAITYPVTPEASERASRRLAGTARIFQFGSSLVHEIDDATRRLPVQLA